MLVKILVVFFCLLLMYQSFLAFYELKEGFQEGFQDSTQDSSQVASQVASQEYQPYNTNDPNNQSGAMILAQQNAGNIEYLKQQISSLSGLQKEVKDTSSTLDQLTEQVLALTQQQEEAAKQMVGTEPVQVTGIESSSSESSMAPF
jgi:uncharacterized protein involved in exopolysaccharide biosynthesis